MASSSLPARLDVGFGPAFAFSNSGFTESMEMEKPTLWPVGMMAVLMPTTSPFVLKSGPPELPGLMAASVWRNSS